jgi:glycosyltransferase involved in cell wall biosynthesis
MTKPILSVLIDTYNHERYIAQAVVSAIEQDFPAPDYEILVVDDGSTDRTAEIVRQFAPRVRLLSKKNGGQASAFNSALSELRGDIIAFLDGDDWFAPGKLTAVMKALEQNPQVAAATHGYWKFDEETKTRTMCSPVAQRFLNLATHQAALEALEGARYLLMGGLTIRKEMLKRIMPIPQELVFCADAPITLGSLAGGVCLLNEPLFWYRHHSHNLYALDPTNQTKMRRRLAMAERAFQCVEALLTRLGIMPDAVRTLLYPPWIHESRSILRIAGGSRLKTFRTEMRSFRLEFEKASLRYRLFKYLFVGGATLVFPARTFYKARDWYGRMNLAKIREQLFRAHPHAAAGPFGSDNRR